MIKKSLLSFESITVTNTRCLGRVVCVLGMPVLQPAPKGESMSSVQCAKLSHYCHFIGPRSTLEDIKTQHPPKMFLESGVDSL